LLDGVGEDLRNAMDFFHKFQRLAFACGEDDPVGARGDGVGDHLEGCRE